MSATLPFWALILICTAQVAIGITLGTVLGELRAHMKYERQRRQEFTEEMNEALMFDQWESEL